MNNGLEVYDQSYTFSIIEHDVQEDFDLTGYDLLVYLALKYFAGHRESDGATKCWPSTKNIVRFARCSAGKTFECLKKLETLGYIERKQRRDGFMKMSTVYYIRGRKKTEKKQVDSTGWSQDLHPVELPTPCGGDRTRSKDLELDLKEPNTPLSPQGESTADSQQQSELPFEGQRLSREIIAQIMGEFAVSNPAALEEAVQRWIAAYGGEWVKSEIKTAVMQNADNGHKRKSAVRFLGGWLRRGAQRRPAQVDKETAALFDELFGEFWKSWPGLDEGKEGARQEFHRRFASLPDRDARNRGLGLLTSQLQSLIARAEGGEARKYLPRAKTFLRDADLAG